MSLLDGVDLTTGIDEAEKHSRPLCNPCRQGDCARCPTVLAANGIIDSDFPCRCHAENPEAHEGMFDDRQGEIHDAMEDGWFLSSLPPEHFGRPPGDAPDGRRYDRWDMGKDWDGYTENMG